MKRVAFTIILNGLHHLTHNNFYENMCSYFDLWVIVDGVSLPNGSTSWCKILPENVHNNYSSNDGTLEFLQDRPKSNVVVIRSNGPWLSKDIQINAANEYIKRQYSKCFLWQVDVDEQWTLSDLQLAEETLIANNGKTGCFLCNYFVGPNQQVHGEWGENTKEPYRRLWSWEGELFKTHEPPILEGKNGPGFLLPPRFNHYSYYFDQDVLFKEKYYGGYDGLYNRWKNIQSNRDVLHVRHLLGPNIHWSYTNSIIKYVNDN